MENKEKKRYASKKKILTIKQKQENATTIAKERCNTSKRVKQNINFTGKKYKLEASNSVGAEIN